VDSVPGVAVSLASLLAEHPAGDADPLLHTADESLTAGAARSQARALAQQLHTQGVEAGQAVAVRLANGPGAITAMFAVWEAGAVFVPLNVRAPQSEIDHQLSAIDPAAVIDADGITARGHARVYADGVAFVTWTSGTTGVPKPVLHTHVAYLELLDRVLNQLQGNAKTSDRKPTPNLVPVSLALNAGIYNVCFGLRAGAEIVVMDRFAVDVFAELVRRFAIRSTVLPPAAMTMLNDADGVTDLSPLRYVRSITAPLSPLQAQRFMAKFGVVVLNSYGQAELGEVVGWTAADARDHPEKLGAAGRPHPGVDLKLADAHDGVGSLLVRPPATATGIDPGRIDTDGFVDTGDLARIDSDGFVWIEGRKGDVINRGGNKVFPGHVEEVLRLVPGVVEAAVVGAPDDRLGEVPVAFVVTSAPVTDEALADACREHLVAYKVPAAFHRVDALPRNEVGKVLRRELLDSLG
jgi:acyl-coenzyme A synthetase/AMP-(fatty) acid ligase